MEWFKEWLRNVAFYYLFMTVISNVLPDGKEKKYVEFFMGLLITLFLLRPILHLGNLEQGLEQNVLGNMIEGQWEQLQQEIGSMDIVGENYILQACKEEMESQIGQWVAAYGYEVVSCKIDLIMEEQMEFRMIRLRLKSTESQTNGESSDEQEEFIKKEFMEVYNIPEGNINISIQG